MKVTFTYNFNTDDTKIKFDKIYLESFFDIDRLDFLRDALYLLQKEYDKQHGMLMMLMRSATKVTNKRKKVKE